MTQMRLLILGGYGTFGGRLARLLADEPRLTLIIAGRAHDKAAAFCTRLAASARLEPLAFDRDGDVERALAAAKPDVVVDASGPFQNYAGDPYRLVRACLALGIDYLDLADGSDFVDGIAQFDAAAQTRGVAILSGVSSFPVLTAAVVRRLAHGRPPQLARLDSVSGGIAPSPYAGVGLNVIRAIASYAGKPVRLTRDGRPAVGLGLIETRRFTIAPPGCVPLRPTLFSLVDVPDLQALPKLWPELKSVWLGAGPVPQILHRALNLFARAVPLGLLRTLAPFAPLMHAVVNVLRWGEHRGGMFVAVEGADAEGRRIARSWHMIAEGDDGPLIPSMAGEALIRRRLAGKRPAPGARAATGDLELDDYEALFTRRKIVCGIRETPAVATPLYRRLLGDAYAQLPAPVQAMHDLVDTLSVEGRATIERGRNLVARAIAAAVGFPPAGENVPVKVVFTPRDGREIWRRTFADHGFTSTQEEGRGSFDRLMCERVGPFAFGIAITHVPAKWTPVRRQEHASSKESRACSDSEGSEHVFGEADRLRLVVRRWSVFGIPLPSALAPFGSAYESVEDGRFYFHVEIRLALIGLVVGYRGWLMPRP